LHLRRLLVPALTFRADLSPTANASCVT